jgi:hypothetical protein
MPQSGDISECINAHKGQKSFVIPATDENKLTIASYTTNHVGLCLLRVQPPRPEYPNCNIASPRRCGACGGVDVRQLSASPQLSAWPIGVGDAVQPP